MKSVVQNPSCHFSFSAVHRPGFAVTGGGSTFCHLRSARRTGRLSRTITFATIRRNDVAVADLLVLRLCQVFHPEDAEINRRTPSISKAQTKLSPSSLIQRASMRPVVIMTTSYPPMSGGRAVIAMANASAKERLLSFERMDRSGSTPTLGCAVC